MTPLQKSFFLRFFSVVAVVFSISIVAASQDNGDFFDSNGVRIHYVDTGEGEPVVLMHGLNSSMQRAWFDTGIAEKIRAAGYRVLALDARAHGKSGTPHDPARYGPEMALDIERLLSHVGAPKAHVVGYSMGAVIAGKLRELRPERIISLTLGGYGWYQEEGPSPYLVELAESLERGEGFMPLYRNLYPDWSEEDREARSRASVARLPDVQATIAMLRGYKFGVSEGSLRNNAVPTIAIIGEIDPRKATVDALQGVMPNLEVAVINGADHAEAVRRPEFTTHVITFLRQHPADSMSVRLLLAAKRRPGDLGYDFRF